MNPPLYALVDRRTSDGCLRVIAEYREVDDAVAACTALRQAGSGAWVVLVTAIRDEGVNV